jgi:hypothetical protein
LLRCWRFDAAENARNYPWLISCWLALGHRDVAPSDWRSRQVALAPEVPTVRSVALRCREPGRNREPMIRQSRCPPGAAAVEHPRLRGRGRPLARAGGGTGNGALAEG